MSFPTPSRPHGRRAASAFLALALAATAGGATVLTTPAADSDLALVQRPDGAFLVAADGSRRALPLPPRTTLSHLAADGTGWWAAGVAAGDAGASLVLLAGDGGAARSVGTPAIGAPHVSQPTVLVRPAGGLTALLWFEGADSQSTALRLARRQGGGWGAAETIAPQGPGTQTALATAVLADGSVLLAWSAFDGRDDEIVWARLDQRGFTVAAPLADDNAVPDITPHLLATADGGALAVWSRYDGNDYRVQIASYRDGLWSPPRQIGARGSLFPTLAAVGGTPMVVHKTAVPRTWSVLALDGERTVARVASVPWTSNERPLLAHDAAGALALRFLDGDVERIAPLAWQAAEGR